MRGLRMAPLRAWCRVAGFAVAMAAVAHAEPLFDAAFLSYRTAKNPASIVAADVNGDTRPDLVVASADARGFEVFLGRGDGSFTSAHYFSDESKATAVALADWDGDQNLDAVLGTTGSHASGTGKVMIARGDGSGAFMFIDEIPVDGPPYAVVAGDLDGGGPDVVVAHTTRDRISILRNIGGGFAAPESLTVTGSPYSLALGDWDDDGDRDLAVACYASDSVLVFDNDGGATFPGRRALAVVGEPVHVRAALVNADSLLDLVVCNLDPAAISLFFGTGGGSFAPREDIALEEQPFATDVADFDGDGRADLAIATNASFDRPANHVVVLRGTAAGFEPPRAFAAARQPRTLAIADFDGDTRADLAVPGFDSSTLAVLLGRGDGTFGAQVTAATQRDPVAVAFGDLNGDGRGDLAVATFPLDTLTVLLGQPDGSFGARVDYETSAAPLAVATAHLNPDGFLDVLVVNAASNSISAYLGVGDGSLQPRSDFEANEGPTSLVVADFDRDGDADVAACNRLTNDVSVLIGRNDGFFDYKVDYPVGLRPQQIVTADVNHDSIPDLAVANSGESSLSVLLGRGDGTFDAQVAWMTMSEPRLLAIGDVDQDGNPDIVAVSTNSGFGSALLGNGDGTFRSGGWSAWVGDVPVSIALGDVGGDGKLDLFVADDATNTIAMLMGFGTYGFGDRADFGTGGNPRSLNLVDVDDDGALDLLMTNQSENQIAVMRNRRDRTPNEVEFFAAEPRGGAVELRWRLSGAARLQLDHVRVERAVEEGGPWESRAELGSSVEVFVEAPVIGAVWYRLALVHRDGVTTFTPPLEVVAVATASNTLRAFAVGPDEIQILFTLARGPADLAIHDVRGRLVRRFGRAATSAGTHFVTWDRTDAAGRRAARGVYFVQLVTPVGTSTRRLLLH